MFKLQCTKKHGRIAHGVFIQHIFASIDDLRSEIDSVMEGIGMDIDKELSEIDDALAELEEAASKPTSQNVTRSNTVNSNFGGRGRTC